jgi:hypothetical protein
MPGTSSLSQRQEKVLHYIIGRIDKDVPLQQILQEDYVRRNCSQTEIEQIISHPEFVQAARERLGGVVQGGGVQALSIRLRTIPYTRGSKNFPSTYSSE